MTSSDDSALQGEPGMTRKGHSKEETNGEKRTTRNETDHLLKTFSSG